MIELKAPLSIKNEYVLELYDKDGKLKDKAYAYNLVTDLFWAYAFTASWSPFNNIQIGTGTGTPSVTDTNLFKKLQGVSSTRTDVIYAYPTSTATYTATFTASASSVGVITEVGFAESNATGYLQTHALLQDSEGNPITINKTDTDTLIVTAKVHCTVSASDDLKLVPADSFVGFTRTFSKGSENLMPASFSLATSPASPTNSTISESNRSNTTSSVSNRSFTTPVTRMGQDTGNNRYINAVYAGGFGTVRLPNESIFPAYELQPMPVGTGDGSTTEFKCPIPDFVENTETITVDGVELTRNVDYTVDPIGNTVLNTSAISAYSNFAESISASLSSSSSSYPWFQFGINAYYGAGLLIGMSDKPMTFDLGSEKTCNALFTDLVLAEYDYPRSATDCTLTLEYSNDNVSWQAATSVDTKFIGATNYSSYPSEYENMLTKFDPITARYWRIYSSGSSSYLSKGLGCWCNSFFGYVGDGIVFKEPPAEGAEIKIKATVNRPYKTSDYLIDFQISTYF